MNRTLAALSLAVAMLLASALAVAVPGASWTAVAGPSILVLALLGTDLALRRRAVPSASVLLLAAAMVVACAIVASRGLDRLAEFIPLLGSCAALPVLLRREGAGPSCRRA
jgi:hypothetical protein